ncbi:MAG: hypothetical protein ACI8PZ_005831 [Myxococcota bacterium]|jgi:hypothetical protein
MRVLLLGLLACGAPDGDGADTDEASTGLGTATGGGGTATGGTATGGTATGGGTTPDGRIEDVFTLSDEAVDILFVVDTSCSMSSKLAAISNASSAILEPLLESGADWHLGVISMDMDDPGHSGRLQEADGDRWVQRDTPSPTEWLSSATDLGLSESSAEQGRAAAYTALVDRADDWNAGFVRETSSLHLLFVSEEDDQSSGSPVGEAAFIDMLLGMSDRPVVQAHAIVTPAGAGADAGHAYIAYAEATGGFVGDVRAPDPVPIVVDMVADIPPVPLTLSSFPVVDTLVVEVNADGPVYVFTYEDGELAYDALTNTVEFVDFIPSPGAVVIVSYDPA